VSDAAGEHPGPQPRVSSLPLRAGLAQSDLSIEQLWYRYIAVGGTLPAGELDAALHGPDLSTGEFDRIAQALNDYFVDHGGDHPVAYSDEVNAPTARRDRDGENW
jgi:hypothetical protein